MTSLQPLDPISQTIGNITPHGGELVNRILTGKTRIAALVRAQTLPQIRITPTAASDLEMIATGAYSPLTGFMIEQDYLAVRDTMRLANGLVWPVPITMAPLVHSQAENVNEGDEVALIFEGQILALMSITDKYTYDKKIEGEKIYGTKDPIKHPGVMRLNVFQGNILLGGDIWLIDFPKLRSIPELRLSPFQTRQLFLKMGWQTIAGFQTRNPPHRAHEIIQQLALQQTDGLFIQPLVGTTRYEELPVELRVGSYQLVIDLYDFRDRTTLSLFPAAMCFAGPREAIFHALCRKNYGCTHFIVGRDHAGIGGFYEPDAAIKAFDLFDEEELEIKPITPNYVYCKECGKKVINNSCTHNKMAQIKGSQIRQMLLAGKKPPSEIMRPEVSKYLIEELKKYKQRYIP